MNSDEERAKKLRDEMNKHFLREQRTAKARARLRRSREEDFLRDQIKQTDLDDVVHNSDYNPEYTSFNIQ